VFFCFWFDKVLCDMNVKIVFYGFRSVLCLSCLLFFFFFFLFGEEKTKEIKQEF
jgi:hypothetical protein